MTIDVSGTPEVGDVIDIVRVGYARLTDDLFRREVTRVEMYNGIVCYVLLDGVNALRRTYMTGKTTGWTLEGEPVTIKMSSPFAELAVSVRLWREVHREMGPENFEWVKALGVQSW